MEFMILMGAVQAGAAIYSGMQAKKAANSQAAIKEEEAQLQKDVYDDRAINMGIQGEAFVGNQKSAFASSGVVATEGSPLAVLRETQRSIQSDISRTRQTGQKVYDLGMNQAESIRKYGSQQQTAGIVSGAAGFLGTLGNAYSYKEYWK